MTTINNDFAVDRNSDFRKFI